MQNWCALEEGPWIYAHGKKLFSFFLSMYSQCGELAFLATQHITVCLDVLYMILVLVNIMFLTACNILYSIIQQTPVHHAVMNVSPLCLQTLLEWGGDLYQQDKDGKSPMDYMTNSSPLSFRLTIKQYCGKVTEV